MPESSQTSEARRLLYKYATFVLNARPYFKHQLRLKLFQRAAKLKIEAPEPTIDSILNGLDSAGYLNDSFLAEAYVRRQLSKGYGPEIISLKLRRLGLSSTAISEAVRSEVTSKSEIVSIRQYLRKYSNLDQRKLVSRLYSRGFTSQSIKKVFDSDSFED